MAMTPVFRRTGLPLALMLLLGVSGLSADVTASDPVLRGRPQSTLGSPPPKHEPFGFVAEDGSKHRVSGDEFSVGQLFDPRLAGRLWDLEGTYDLGGTLRIHRLFTVKDGKRFRVAYYCVICNIYQHEPGRCMCCQDETELQEISEE